MAIFTDKKEIETLREGGKILGAILKELARAVRPGISAADLDQLARQLIKKAGAQPAFLGYRPDGAPKPFPAALCVSVNDEVVHGLPSPEKILKEGDIVSLDLGLKYRELFTDAALTVPVGKISKESQKLISVTQEALAVGIAAARAGGHVGDIGAAVESLAKKHGLGIVRELAGHGLGRAIHEDPHVPNFGLAGSGTELRPGMLIAIEPMLTLGSDEVVTAADGFTVRTRDGKRSAHFEHTIIVAENGPEVLTKIKIHNNLQKLLNIDKLWTWQQ